MKVKILYKALDLRGNIVKLKIDHECPDFKEESFSYKDVNFTNTVNSQIIDWLDELDKMYIIYENDLQCIIDYEVIESDSIIKKPSKKEQFERLVDTLIKSEEMNIDVKLTYVGMYDSIKSLKVGKQLEIVLDSLGLSYMTKIDAYQNIIDILNKPIEEVKQLKNEK